MAKHSYLYYDEWNSPLGVITLVATDDGICHINFGSMEDLHSSLTNWARKYFLCTEFKHDEERLANAKEQLEAYFDKKLKDFDLDLDLYGTPFQQKVWRALYDIPFGETKSYKEIAQVIQAPKAVRAVGGAINRNPLAIIVPCHRVIGSNGALVGYAGGLDKKKHLLNHEEANVLA